MINDGTSAMCKHLLAMEERDINEMTLDDLQPLNTFSLLLTAAMEEKLSTWMSRVMGRNLGNNNDIVIADSGISAAQRAALTALTG